MPEDKKVSEVLVSELVAAIWAGQPKPAEASKDAFENKGLVMIQGEAPAPTHTQPVHRNARDLKQIYDAVELARWFSEFGEQATPKRIGEIWSYERDNDIPENQQMKWYRR